MSDNKYSCAVVTGGTRGIGRAVVDRFIRNGIRTIILSKDSERLKSTTEHFGDRCTGLCVDLACIEDIKYAFDDIIRSEPKIGILVNNAGICNYSDYFSISLEQFRKTLDVNLTGHFFLTQLVAENMVKNHIKGSIINMGSLNSFFGGATQVDYSISKAGIHLFTRSLSASLGPYGIRVNTVCPGIIPTDINKKRYADATTKAERIKKIPLGRFGTPGEIASVVSFLASSEASYITGQAIIVDGGWSATY